MEGDLERGRERRRTRRRPAGTPSRGVSPSIWSPREFFGSPMTMSTRTSPTGRDEGALRLAALENLPAYDRMRTGILRTVEEAADGKRMYKHQEVDVRKMGMAERQEFIDRILKVAEEDNARFLKKLRDRFNRVSIQLPTVEVRFKHLTVEAECYVGNRALPTLINTSRNIVESVLGVIGIRMAKTSTLTILKDTSGIIKPSRMTLLLGPPSSGKTTLLLALAGRLDPSLQSRGDITYNGHRLTEFVPPKTSAYISQHDNHLGEMTVKETLDFSVRCQGVGDKYDLLRKLARKEKEAGIHPEAEVDLFMKATAIEGVGSSLQTDYTMKILGIDVCADILIGDEMRRGISGGQKKRVTTGEMIVGPTKTLFMDEISTGLDTSTTFQIVKCLQQIVHLGEATILMSLLQPAPETYDLFDDVILISEGQIVYQGPRQSALEFFDSCGFRCPERKGAADFLQEVTSRKDQEQYWASQTKPYRYVSVTEFVARFKRFHVGQRLRDDLSTPFNKKKIHKQALVFSKYSVSTLELLKTSFSKEWLLIKRNSFLYVFKTVQLIIVGIIGATVYFRTRMHTNTENDGFLYIGALLFSLNVNMFNGFAEASITIARLPTFYKHRDLLFFPPWIFTLPNFLIRIPISILESVVWVGVGYFIMGFAPEASRFFKQLLIVFLVQQMAAGLFRMNASICRSVVVTNTVGSLAVLTTFVLGGFIIPKDKIPKWWIWGYWGSPLTYAYNALAVNEMFSSRWMDKFAPDGRRLGVAVLEDISVPVDENWYWIGAGALLGIAILFNILFTFALMYLNPLGKAQAVISEEEAMEMEALQDEEEDESPRFRRMGAYSKASTPRALSVADGSKTFESMIPPGSLSRTSSYGGHSVDMRGTPISPKNGMVLPFIPLAMSFKNVNYYVDMPVEMKAQGVAEERLQLLNGVTGAFRPGVLTALMGVSGAGKTTLMDVLAGRKTGGYIEGDIRISGYPKFQETFARVSGYCEQTDVHSPQITVLESLIFSAFLRLPKEIEDREKMEFVEEVMDLVELDVLKDALVGLPGVSGLSTEQRKRLTIAVELVANPSIIFMDEPTSGLDARAAAIVMRTVRNTVDTGRTVVCTIHQPSIDIFESFDELILLKRGGQVIYSGPLGENSNKLVEYFEGIPGVQKMRDKYNPATWMLEVTSITTEEKLGIDFGQHYQSSNICKRNKALVRGLNKPLPGTDDIYFRTQYSQSMFGQFKSCLWKQWWTYWRNPEYNLARLLFTFATAILLGGIFWNIGQKRESSTELTIITGAMYAAVLFAGVINCISVQSIVGIERMVFYRERAAGMYSALPYAFSQVAVEIPYILFQSIYYTLIVYSMMGFEWKATKFLWFLYISFITFLYFTYYGMLSVAISPNLQVAGIFSASFYSLFNLFSGFFIPKPKIPNWWIWYYWICPVSWTVYGLIVSQYGDLEDIIKVPGEQDTMIKSYVKDRLGYDHDFLGVVGVVLAAFALFFAVMFVYCIRKFNFQQR